MIAVAYFPEWSDAKPMRRPLNLWVYFVAAMGGTFVVGGGLLVVVGIIGAIARQHHRAAIIRDIQPTPLPTVAPAPPPSPKKSTSKKAAAATCTPCCFFSYRCFAVRDEARSSSWTGACCEPVNRACKGFEEDAQMVQGCTAEHKEDLRTGLDRGKMFEDMQNAK